MTALCPRHVPRVAHVQQRHQSARLVQRRGCLAGAVGVPLVTQSFTFGSLCAQGRGFRRSRRLGQRAAAAAPRLEELEMLANEIRISRDMGPVRENLEDPAYYAFPSYYTRGDGSQRGFCNWLLRDVLMVGRYPYCDPLGDFPSKLDGRRHLTKMLDAGITAFVCMQAEIPSSCTRKLESMAMGRRVTSGNLDHWATSYHMSNIPIIYGYGSHDDREEEEQEEDGVRSRSSKRTTNAAGAAFVMCDRHYEPLLLKGLSFS